MEVGSSTENGRRLPPLLPAPAGTSPQDHSQSSENAKASRKPRVGACNTCRSRKIKCNGQRPTCDKCAIAEHACVYTATESREARRKYFELRDRRNTHEEMIELLKSLPETDVLEVLRRLKSGEDVQQILDSAKQGNIHTQSFSTQSRDSRCALSFIADLPNALEAGSPESTGCARRDSESVASTAESSGTDRPTLV